MKQNKIAQERYQRHVIHLGKDAKYLGDAENLEEITQIVREIRPNVYMLAKSCVDRSPVIQLANWQNIRRIGLKEISQTDRTQLITNLALEGIEYKRTKYLALNPDFTPTAECIHQERFAYLYNAFYELRIQMFLAKRKLRDMI